MTTCRDIVTQALRLGKILASGDDPSADELSDGMVALQSVYAGMVTGGMFGTLCDHYKTADYEAKEGERVSAPAGVAITFPGTLPDYQNGGNRVPRDLSCIETIIDGVRAVKIWDRTGWVSLIGLTASSDAPLADRGATGLAAVLACSGAFLATFGDADVSPRVERLSSLFLRNISHKFGSTQDRSTAEYY